MHIYNILHRIFVRTKWDKIETISTEDGKIHFDFNLKE